jgi:uncharacterized repeat protein (TIGR03806 family)
MNAMCRITLITALIFLPMLTGCGQSGDHTAGVNYRPGENPKTVLSDYRFFTGNPAGLTPNSGVIPYSVISPLFTDYAEKARFIWMPEGTAGSYNDSTFFDLPTGTVLIKNFYYPDDFRDPHGKRRIFETRLLVHEPGGWRGLPYIWNEEQTEAYLSVAGGETDVRFTDLHGEEISLRYLIPNANQCQSCHFKNGSIVPIGIQARHLNKEYAYEDGMENQLVRWHDTGILDAKPDPVNAPAIADYRDSTISIDARARAYLDMNCGHCHNPGGPGSSSGLFLHFYESNPASLGIMKPPVAAGRGSGGKQFSILPGAPDESILLYRMNSNEPGVMMPEIGRTLIDKEAVELIKAWIADMQ